MTKAPIMTAVTPSREALLAGDELSEAHALLKQCGYNFSEAHPECYREACRNHIIPITACDRALFTRAISRALSEPKR